ncbi:MAG: phosphoribosylformylglycinamidine synthase subunit PurQ [Desulfobacteraceae bacterium]|nr:phosphoribosylformylglycinamidine synthase subunit PurQ [Desulfobacteraceae bacterium]
MKDPRKEGGSASGVRALVLTGFGLNCDHETAHALRLAGASAERVHINALIDGSVSLERFQLLVFIGGFSWADDHGAGVIQAVRMKTRIGGELLDFIRSGNLVLGICNGFQTLVNIGLLPGFDGDYTSRRVALMANDCGNFRDQWVNLLVQGDSRCVFTSGMDRLELPIRHGEGKFTCEPGVLEKLSRNGQVVLRYERPDGEPAGGAFPFNPNGSLQDIAGICDATGRVFGLMPHPEAYLHWTNHPDWARWKSRLRRSGRTFPSEPTPGVRIFQNAVAYLSGEAGGSGSTAASAVGGD